MERLVARVLLPSLQPSLVKKIDAIDSDSAVDVGSKDVKKTEPSALTATTKANGKDDMSSLIRSVEACVFYDSTAAPLFDSDASLSLSPDHLLAEWKQSNKSNATLPAVQSSTRLLPEHQVSQCDWFCHYAPRLAYDDDPPTSKSCLLL